MYVIHANNPDDALEQGLLHLTRAGITTQSRNGPVLVAPGPVTTVYASPWDHVSAWPVRDANPFFHLVEAMWMLLGRRDVELVAKYAASMKDFSDDTKTLYGAYGYRWRSQFHEDQLNNIVNDLTADPSSRRAVLSMWDGYQDPNRARSGGLDVPCNTHAYFMIMDGKLDMTVCCRSNDAVWGAHGANVVHFSVLQQYMAERIGVGIGTYRQMSNNYHAYIERPDVKKLLFALEDGAADVSGWNGLPTPKLLIDPEPETHVEFMNDVDGALSDPLGRSYSNNFVRTILVPMLIAHMLHKAGLSEQGMDLLDGPSAWHKAGRAWLSRRIAKLAEQKETR